ncbi:MAG: hypothetical protein Kow0069_14070 [Promethearchaeota archaeon]
MQMAAAGGLMGFVGLFVTGLGTPPHVTAFFRGALGSAWLTALLAARGRLGTTRLLGTSVPGATLLAASNASTIAFYFATIVTSGYGVAAFLLYTGGAFAVALSRLVLKEPVPRSSVAAFAAAIAGVALLARPWTGDFGGPGLLTGLLSGACLGGNTLSKKIYYSEFARRGRPVPGDLPVALAWWAVTSMALVFAVPALIHVASNGWPDLLLAAGLGLFPTALAFTLFNSGLRSDDGGDVLAFSYSEPVVATALGVVLGQPLSPLDLAGGALVVGANALAARSPKSLINLPARISK